MSIYLFTVSLICKMNAIIGLSIIIFLDTVGQYSDLLYCCDS